MKRPYERADSPVTPAELKLRLGVFRKICDAVAFAHRGTWEPVEQLTRGVYAREGRA